MGYGCVTIAIMLCWETKPGLHACLTLIGELYFQALQHHLLTTTHSTYAPCCITANDFVCVLLLDTLTLDGQFTSLDLSISLVAQELLQVFVITFFKIITLGVINGNYLHDDIVQNGRRMSSFM